MTISKTRDPRYDPQRGDVLRLGAHRYLVEGADSLGVRYHGLHQEKIRDRIISLKKWREYMAYAEVTDQ